MKHYFSLLVHLTTSNNIHNISNNETIESNAPSDDGGIGGL